MHGAHSDPDVETDGKYMSAITGANCPGPDTYMNDAKVC